VLSRKIINNRLRRKIIAYLYQKYEDDALCPVSFLHMRADFEEDKEALVSQLRYLEGAGFIKVNWNLTGSGIIRFRTEGVDLAEDEELLEKLFPAQADHENLPLTPGGDRFVRTIEYDERLKLKEKVELIEVVRAIFSDVKKGRDAGVDFAKVYRMMRVAVEKAPHLAKEMLNNLEPDPVENFDTWRKKEPLNQ
jgi:DNA-binding transcriptional ArsR family regulator